MEWIIKGELKFGYLFYYEEAFNENMDACEKTEINVSNFFLRNCFCLKIIQPHFYNLCSSNLYTCKLPSYMQDVQKLLQMMSFKGMAKNVNKHVRFMFFFNCLKIWYLNFFLSFFCIRLLIFAIVSFYVEWLMFYEIWISLWRRCNYWWSFLCYFWYYLYSCEINVHPTHDGHSYTM